MVDCPRLYRGPRAIPTSTQQQDTKSPMSAHTEILRPILALLHKSILLQVRVAEINGAGDSDIMGDADSNRS
jgi:hypothetical protein